MTAPSITALIFGHDTEPPACASCAGVGLTGIDDAEMPALCQRCGGSGFGNVLDHDPVHDPQQLRLDLGDDGDAVEFDDDANFSASFREPATDAGLDEDAANLVHGLLAGIAEYERRFG